MTEPKDTFIPTLDRELGSIHPINQVKFELIKLLTSFGFEVCLLYTSPSPRDVEESRMPSSA